MSTPRGSRGYNAELRRANSPEFAPGTRPGQLLVPKAGPCIRFYPVLDKLVHELEGKLLLVNVNTDEQRIVATQYGVSSVPTLKLFRRREVVETLHGYHNETDLRDRLRKHLVNDGDSGLGKALGLYRDGAAEGAFGTLVDAALRDPDDMRVPLTLAKLLVREGRPDEAFDLLNALPSRATL